MTARQSRLHVLAALRKSFEAVLSDLRDRDVAFIQLRWHDLRYREPALTQEEMVALELRNSLALVATLGAGLLAGILVGTGMAAFTAKALPSTAWVTRFQLEDRLFTKAMPPLMLGTLLALVAASVSSRGASRLIFFTSIVLTVLVLVVTVAFEVPLNNEIQSWTAAPPPHWQRIRDLWLQRHLLRTIAAGLAFVAALIGLTFR